MITCRKCAPHSPRVAVSAGTTPRRNPPATHRDRRMCSRKQSASHPRRPIQWPQGRTKYFSSLHFTFLHKSPTLAFTSSPKAPSQPIIECYTSLLLLHKASCTLFSKFILSFLFSPPRNRAHNRRTDGLAARATKQRPTTRARTNSAATKHQLIPPAMGGLSPLHSWHSISANVSSSVIAITPFQSNACNSL